MLSLDLQKQLFWHSEHGQREIRNAKAVVRACAPDALEEMHFKDQLKHLQRGNGFCSVSWLSRGRSMEPACCLECAPNAC